MTKSKTVCPEVETSTSVFEKIDILARAGTEPAEPAARRPDGAPELKVVEEGVPPAGRGLNLRQLLFRCVRLMLAGLLVLGAGAYFWDTFTQVTSEQAVVTTDIVALRTPIEGLVRIGPLAPGTELPAGATVFRVENPRAGNKEAASQLNFVREQVERLQAETEEAAVRLAKQAEIFAYHEKLHSQKLIADLDFLNEETRLALARSAWSNKLVQLRRAEARAREVEQQLSLQREATVTMPFAGTVWAVSASDGAPVYANETVVRVFDPKRVWVEAFVHEKHADKFTVGTPVFIRTIDGKTVWSGLVEAIRGRGGPSTAEGVRSVLPTEPPPGRMAVRVRMERFNPFTAREFYGVGRSLVVSLEKP